MPPPYNDQIYISALGTGDPLILHSLIKESWPIIRNLICSLGGTQDDAKDVQGTVLEILFKLQSEGRLNIDTSLWSYMYVIALNLIKRESKKKKTAVLLTQSDLDIQNQLQDPAMETLIIETERMNFFRKKIGQLQSGCQSLLLYCWSDEKPSMDQVARQFNWSGVNTASVRKHECIKKLIQLVKNDPYYKEYI